MKKYMPLCIIFDIFWRKPKYMNGIFFLFPDRESANLSNMLERVDCVDCAIFLFLTDMYSVIYVRGAHMCWKHPFSDICRVKNHVKNTYFPNNFCSIFWKHNIPIFKIFVQLERLEFGCDFHCSETERFLSDSLVKLD